MNEFRRVHKHRIQEITTKELMKASSPEPWKEPIDVRSSGYRMKIQDLLLDRDKEKCVFSFMTGKAGHSIQHVFISFLNFWDMYDAALSSSSEDIELEDVLELAMFEGDVEVSCTCPAWLYSGNKYIATQLDYAYGEKEHRFPKVKNPKLKGTLCKHLYAVIKNFPAIKATMAKWILLRLEKHPEWNGQKFFEKQAEDIAQDILNDYEPEEDLSNGKMEGIIGVRAKRAIESIKGKFKTSKIKQWFSWLVNKIKEKLGW